MNRQVPEKNILHYTIVGDGKVAKHFAHYFNLLGIKFNQWNRKQTSQDLKQLIKTSDNTLLLISDGAILDFTNQHSFLTNNKLIHFSGTLDLDNVYGCHPLMTFGHELYDLETYLSIPFVCNDATDFQSLLPALANKSFSIDKKEKAYYHSLCVIAGNFTQTLMRETSKQLTENLDLPKDILFPYLLQNTKNFINSPESSATGPVSRNDLDTIKKHIKALDENSLQGIYKSFLEYSDLPLEIAL